MFLTLKMLILTMKISFFVTLLTVIGFCENLSLTENIEHGNLERSYIAAENAENLHNGNNKKNESTLNITMYHRGCFDLCKSSNTECVYDVIEEKPFCICKDENFRYVDNECKAMCEYSEDCKNGGTCTDERTCECLEGTSGDHCEEIVGCEYLKCEENGAECVLSMEMRKATCACRDKTQLYIKEKCVAMCESSEDCRNGGTCTDERACECLQGTSGDHCEEIVGCDYLKCEEIGAECVLNMDMRKATCVCKDANHLYVNEDCISMCVKNEDCRNGGICGEKRICECLEGTTGEHCEIVIDCKDLKCENIGAECWFDIEIKKATCACKDTNQLYVNGNCVEMCEKDEDCQNLGECVAHICRCKPGTSGDDCSITESCDALQCELGGAVCIYDESRNEHFCQCKDNRFIYKNNTCISKFCAHECNDSRAVCSSINGVEVCVCEEVYEYYDYASHTCKKIDRCLTERECGKNEICRNETCQCKDYYEHRGECELVDMCRYQSCFNSSTCKAGDEAGYVICECDPKHAYYNRKRKRCEDASCILLSRKKSCNSKCPLGMKRNYEGECEPINNDQKCGNIDCGPYGWCMRVHEDHEECFCDPIFAVKNNGKCELNADEVCPTKQTQIYNPNKCNCTHPFKYSKNGITCERKSCSDLEVKKECKSRGAVCVDDWKSTNSAYKCVCPLGQILNENGKCSDPCDKESSKLECWKQGRSCYLGKNSTTHCRCPPTFIYNQSKGLCEPYGQHAFMLYGLPVLSKKYLNSDKSVDKTSLSTDIIQSMSQAYSNLEFAHLFKFSKEGDAILCSIWIQFKTEPSSVQERWLYQTEHTKAENVRLFPPALLLNGELLDRVTVEKLSFCSKDVKDMVCGRAASCSDEKCFCSEGYRTIDSSVQIFGDKTVLRCEDIDECSEGIHDCTVNTTCINTLGDYYCECRPGFKKKHEDRNRMNKMPCKSFCDPNPCDKGTCEIGAGNSFLCSCHKDYIGSLCNVKITVKSNNETHLHFIGFIVFCVVIIIGLVGALLYLKIRRRRT